MTLQCRVCGRFYLEDGFQYDRHNKFYGHGKMPPKTKTSRRVVKKLGRPAGLGKTYAHRRTALAAGRLALSRNPGAEVLVIDRPDGLFDMVVTI